MAPPVYISFFPDTTAAPFPGTHVLPDHNDEPGKKSCIEVLALEHGKGLAEVSRKPKRPASSIIYRPEPPTPDEMLERFFGKETSDFFKKFTGRGVWIRMDGRTHLAAGYTRKHADFYVTLPLTQATAYLYERMCRSSGFYDFKDSFLNKAELYFYRYDETMRTNREYFRITFEHVSIMNMKLIMPNVKNPAFEHYDAMVEIGLRYAQITWRNFDTQAYYTDHWNGGLFATHQKDLDAVEEQPEEEDVLFALNFRSALMVEPKTGFDYGKPFEAKIDSILSRSLEPFEREMAAINATLISSYKDTTQEHSTLSGYVGANGRATFNFPSLPENDTWKSDTEKSADNPPTYWIRATSEQYQGFRFDGEKVEIGPGVQVSLYEYTNLTGSCEADGGKIGNIITGLRKHHTVAVTGSKTTLANDKWVYAFKKLGGSVSLSYECRATVQNGKPSFAFVSWAEADRDANMKTYPRKEGATKSAFTLAQNTEYYVLLSRIQLPVARIDWYAKNPERLAERSLHIPADALKPGIRPLPLYLTEYFEIAHELREEYDKHVQSYEKFVADKEKAQRRYLAGLVCAVAESKPRLKGWLDYAAVEKERDDSNRDTAERLKSKATTEAYLRDWKLGAGFQLTREDYAGTKEIEEALLAHEAALTSEDEIKYLEAEGENKESWYNKIFEPEGKFQFYRKLETLAATDKFWDLFGKYIIAKYLANYGPTKWTGVLTVDVIVQRMERFLGEIHTVIEHVNIKFKDLAPNNKGKWFYVTIDEQTKLPFIDYEFNESGQAVGHTMKYRPVKWKWNAFQRSMLPSLQKVLIGIEAVNLANSMYCAFKADTTKDKLFGGINAIGSTADLLASFKPFAEHHVAVWHEAAGKTAEEAAKIAERTFARINFVGAVCDYVGALKDTAEASYKGHSGLAAGHAAIALSAVALGTSEALSIGTASAALAGTEATAAFTAAFGMSSATLGVVGIALFVVGAGVVWYFSDSELREWAEKSAWSNNPEKAGGIEKQIEELHKLICEFTADGYLYENRIPCTEYFTAEGSVRHKLEYLFTVRIRPGYFSDHASKYIIKLKITHEGGLFGRDRILLDKKVVLPASEARKVRTLQGEEHTVLLQRYTGQELGLSGDFQNDKFTYELKAHLDFYGNGSEVYFDVKNKGTMEIRGMDA